MVGGGTISSPTALVITTIKEIKMKIAINKCFGGFSLSKSVFEELGVKWDNDGYLSNEALGIKSDDYNKYRSDDRLIEAIEKIGISEASGSMADIVIVDVPDDIEWELSNYDGIESIHEKHRSW